MTILAAVMTAIDRICAHPETLRAAELHAALQFAASLEPAERTKSFIGAYLRGDRFSLSVFRDWPDFRDRHVALALDTAA